MTSEYTGKILSGKYELLDQIGAGGMGVVYKALNMQMGNIVCIKILKQQVFDSPDAIRRLQREAHALGALDHPNILRVFAFDRDENLFFLVTEYLDGQSLAQLIENQGALSPERVRNLFVQIAEALNYAHSKQIVHRDLKPSNIIITQVDGVETAKILDFGLARVLDDEKFQRLTRTGVLLGTPHYMSPEQCSGGAVSAASDIYSLGCMLYESLAGRPPFSGDSAMAVLYKHLGESAPSLPPSELTNIALRCMEKKPPDRFATCAALLDALIDGYWPQTTARKRERKPERKLPIKALSAAGAALATLLISTMLLFPDTFKLGHASADPRSTEQIFENLSAIELASHTERFDLKQYDKDIAELAARPLQPRQQSRLLRFRAIRAIHLRQFDFAKDLLRESLVTAHQANIANSRAIFDLVQLLQNLNRPKDVISDIEQELSFYKRHPEAIDGTEVKELLELLTRTYVAIPDGTAEADAKARYRKAIPYYRELIELYDAGTVRHAKATCNLARALYNSGERDKALNTLAQWDKLVQGSYEHLARAETQLAAAEIHLRNGELQAAERLYRSIPAITMHEPSGQPERAAIDARTLHGLACIARSRNDAAAHEHYSRAALKLASTHQDRQLIQIIERELKLPAAARHTP